MEENKITSAPSVNRNSVPSREALAGAVARGWCAPENANKTMDEALAWAIVDELQALFAAPQQVDAVQAVPEGYVLARETVVEMPDGKNELGYTLLSGVGIFTSETEVRDAIKELNLPLGWVSMTTRQLLPGWMLAASPSPAVPTRPAWISVAERLPEVNQLAVVFSPPTVHDWPGSVNIQLDCIDENDDDAASWARHNSHYEHFCCVAKPEGTTGPSEKAPYTHWFPIPTAPLTQPTDTTAGE